jgi:hypothetical protein
MEPPLRSFVLPILPVHICGLRHDGLSTLYGYKLYTNHRVSHLVRYRVSRLTVNPTAINMASLNGITKLDFSGYLY